MFLTSDYPFKSNQRVQLQITCSVIDTKKSETVSKNIKNCNTFLKPWTSTNCFHQEWKHWACTVYQEGIIFPGVLSVVSAKISFCVFMTGGYTPPPSLKNQFEKSEFDGYTVIQYNNYTYIHITQYFERVLTKVSRFLGCTSTSKIILCSAT